MEITVVKEFTFDAAHHLPNHLGKCKNLHGHTYKLQIGVKGSIDPYTGMVADFAAIKELVKELIIDPLDHRYLNETHEEYPVLPGFPHSIPTAENMVQWIVGKLQDLFGEEWEGFVRLSFVRLYETPTSYAEWRG